MRPKSSFDGMKKNCPFSAVKYSANNHPVWTYWWPAAVSHPNGAHNQWNKYRAPLSRNLQKRHSCAQAYAPRRHSCPARWYCAHANPSLRRRVQDVVFPPTDILLLHPGRKCPPYVAAVSVFLCKRKSLLMNSGSSVSMIAHSFASSPTGFPVPSINKVKDCTSLKIVKTVCLIYYVPNGTKEAHDLIDNKIARCRLTARTWRKKSTGVTGAVWCSPFIPLKFSSFFVFFAVGKRYPPTRLLNPNESFTASGATRMCPSNAESPSCGQRYRQQSPAPSQNPCAFLNTSCARFALTSIVSPPITYNMLFWLHYTLFSVHYQMLWLPRLHHDMLRCLMVQVRQGKPVHNIGRFSIYTASSRFCHFLYQQSERLLVGFQSELLIQSIDAFLSWLFHPSADKWYRTGIAPSAYPGTLWHILAFYIPLLIPSRAALMPSPEQFGIIRKTGPIISYPAQ